MFQAAADVWRWLRYLVVRPLVPLSPVTTVPSSRHWRHHATGSRVTPPQHVHTQHTFMQLLTAANHSILQGFKNVVALQYTQQPAVSSMATITYTADQLLADIPGYGNYCDAQKNAFYLRSLCLGRGSALSALVGAMHRVEMCPHRRVVQLLVLNIYRNVYRCSHIDVRERLTYVGVSL